VVFQEPDFLGHKAFGEHICKILCFVKCMQNTCKAERWVETEHTLLHLLPGHLMPFTNVFEGRDHQ
jgi:hypothetical protein